MGKKDPCVDEYIAKSADFAKPIMNHIRNVVHDACPDVEEVLKWGMPNFLYKGIMCNMAAFKGHCAFGFWKRKLIFNGEQANASEKAMGNFGRITKISDLPSKKILMNYVKKAMELNKEGVERPPARKAKKKIDLTVPPYLANFLKKNKKALAAFEKFSPTNKREYVMWIAEAKTDETRKKRLETAVEWMSESKVRNWKYKKK